MEMSTLSYAHPVRPASVIANNAAHGETSVGQSNFASVSRGMPVNRQANVGFSPRLYVWIDFGFLEPVPVE